MKFKKFKAYIIIAVKLINKLNILLIIFYISDKIVNFSIGE